MPVGLTSRIETVLPAGSLRRRMAGGAFWAIAGTGFSQGVAFLASIFCGRILGRPAFGELGIVLSTVNLFSTIAALGLGVTGTKHVAEYRHARPSEAGTVIRVATLVSASSGFLVGAGMAVFAGPLAETLKAPHIAGLLRIGAISMFFAAVNGSQLGALTGFEAFRGMAFAGLGRGLTTFPLVVVGVYLYGIRGAMWGYALSGAAGWVFHQAVLRRECARHGILPGYRIQRCDLRLVWGFSLPVLIAGFSYTPALWWSNALLATRAGYSQSGLFHAAFQWQGIILFLAGAISNLGLPMLSSIVPERDIARYRRVFWVNFFATVAVTLAPAAAVAGFSPQIMELYGAEYREGRVALLLVCLSASLAALNISAGHAIWSLDAPRAGMGFALLRGATLVAGAYALVPYGATGLAAAHVATGVVQTVSQAPFVSWLLSKKGNEWSSSTPRSLPDAEPGR